MNFIKNNVKCIIIIILLLILSWYLFIEKENYKSTIFYNYKIVPNIQLKNTLFEFNNNMYGEVSWFVKFNDIKKQSKKHKQYYIIKPSTDFDENWKQYFVLNDIMKIGSLQPTNIGEDIYSISEEKGDNLILKDKNWNFLFINKKTRKISMIDSTWDKISLITSEYDFREFMMDFLRKKIK